MSDQAVRRRPAQLLFSAMLIWYWMLQYTIASGETVERGSVIYFLYIIPISVYAIGSVIAIVLSSIKLGQPASLILWFIIVVVFIALARADFQTVFTFGLFGAAIIGILTFQVSPPPNLLNSLFLISIVLSALCYALGRANYSIIPGYAVDAVYWRISLVPQIAESAFFALIVFFVNLLCKEARFRRTCMILSLYFLLFAALRTTVVAAILASGYLLLTRMGIVRNRRQGLIYFFAAIGSFVGLLLVPELLLKLANLNSDLNFYLFRAVGDVASEEAVVESVFRTRLWAEHLRIAEANLLFGIGTFDFGALSPTLGDKTIGSESFITGLYARIGLPAAILVLAFVGAISQGLRSDGRLHMVAGIILFVAMLAYGGIVAAYNFSFLCMMGLLAAPPVIRERICREQRVA